MSCSGDLIADRMAQFGCGLKFSAESQTAYCRNAFSCIATIRKRRPYFSSFARSGSSFCLYTRKKTPGVLPLFFACGGTWIVTLNP